MFNFNDQATQSNQNNRYKKDAYLNVALPTANEGQGKLGGIGLQMSKAREKQIIEWLTPKETREERLAILKENLILTFNLADGSDSAGFVLPKTAESGLPI